MPRSIPPTFNKTIDGKMSPASPRWAGARGSGSSDGSPNASTLRTASSTSRRGVTAVSSPRGSPLPHGGGGGSSSARGSSAGSRGGMAEPSERGSSRSGSTSKSRKSFEAEYAEGGREEAVEDSGRIRVAVRVRVWMLSPAAYWYPTAVESTDTYTCMLYYCCKYAVGPDRAIIRQARGR